jgi:hypothetical protein
MKPSELMRNLEEHLKGQPDSVKLVYIANRADEFTLESGKPVRDAIDHKTFWIECYHAQLAIEREARAEGKVSA